jgi:hypothetical protein
MNLRHFGAVRHDFRLLFVPRHPLSDVLGGRGRWAAWIVDGFATWH